MSNKILDCAIIVRGNIQDCHEHGKPEFLGTEQRVGLGSPFTQGDIVSIPQDDEDPGSL